MESRAYTAVGVFVLVVAVVMAVFFADGLGDVGGIVTAVAYAFAGALFVLAGTGQSFAAAGTEIGRERLIGVANVVIAVTFVPSVWNAFGGGSGDVGYGVASGIAAATLLLAGFLFLTGRVEQKA